MNIQRKITASDVCKFTDLLPTSDKAMVGECIHALNLAARQIEQLGGDPTICREMVERAMPVRWAA